MSKSPGHQKWPDHKVRELHVGQRVTVDINGRVVADTTDAIRVDEDGQPPRYYVPRDAVRMDQLQRSATSTQCPFKGTAHYFSVRANGGILSDAVWSYEDPYDEHQDLQGRLAFYDGKYPDIHVTTNGGASDA